MLAIDGKIIVLDWLSFTVPYSNAMLTKMLYEFDCEGVPFSGSGVMGYTESVRMPGAGKILWHPARKDMGIHIILPGSALPDLKVTALGAINRVYDWGGKISRLDIAFDDYEGTLDIETMYEKILSGQLVTRFRKVSRIDGASIGKDERTGYTVNVGSRKSEAFIRIYDKAIEQKARGVDSASIPENWIRVEVELKGKKANAFGKLLGETAREMGISAGGICARLLLGLLDFKEENPDDSNKSRWGTSDWWSEFIGENEKLFLSLGKPVKEMEDTRNWIRTQVAVSLAMIVLSADDLDGSSGYDFIISCIEEGAQKIDKNKRGRMHRWDDGREQGRMPV